jgi:hypothetical protein
VETVTLVYGNKYSFYETDVLLEVCFVSVEEECDEESYDNDDSWLETKMLFV